MTTKDDQPKTIDFDKFVLVDGSIHSTQEGTFKFNCKIFNDWGINGRWRVDGRELRFHSICFTEYEKHDEFDQEKVVQSFPFEVNIFPSGQVMYLIPLGPAGRGMNSAGTEITPMFLNANLVTAFNELFLNIAKQIDERGVEFITPLFTLDHK